MNLFKGRASKSVIHYVMLGPHAVDRRILELEKELKLARVHLAKLMSAHFHLESWGLDKVLSRFVRYFRLTANRTVREINSERKALTALVGGTLRTFEVKDSGPAPSI